MGAKEPGVAGSENGGLSRRAFDEQPGKMHQEQETDDLHLFETWKDTIRRTCLHHDAYADAMVGMKETRQFREILVLWRTDSSCHHIYANPPPTAGYPFLWSCVSQSRWRFCRSCTSVPHPACPCTTLSQITKGAFKEAPNTSKQCCMKCVLWPDLHETG